MYNKITYMGKTLKQWADEMNHMFTLGELYRMMLNKEDFKMHVR